MRLDRSRWLWSGRALGSGMPAAPCAMRHVVAPSLSMLLLLAFAQAASATSVCSTSNVHILFDHLQSQCAGGGATASTSQATGDPDLLGEASMAIRAGAFSGIAKMGGANLYPNATTFFSSAIGELADSITPLGSAATGTPFTLVLPLHVTGAFDASFVAPVGVSFPLPFVDDRFSFTCSGFIGASGGDCGHDQIASTVPDMSAPQLVDQTWLLQIPLEMGFATDVDMKFKLGAQMTLPSAVGITCNPSVDVACHDAGDVVFDLSHTGEFEPATIMDGSGHEVFDVTLQSGSGFDYINAVPEPAAPALVACGVLVLGCARRRFF
jgi:hypothetical protein